MQIHNILPLSLGANYQNTSAKRSTAKLRKPHGDIITFSGNNKKEANYHKEWIDNSEVQKIITSIVHSNTKPQISVKDAKKILNHFGYVQMSGQTGDHIYFEPRAYQGKGIIFTIVSNTNNMDPGAVADFKKAIMDLDKNNGELVPGLNTNISEERLNDFRSKTKEYNPEGGNRYRVHLEEYKAEQAKLEAQAEENRQAEERKIRENEEKQQAIDATNKKIEEINQGIAESKRLSEEIQMACDDLLNPCEEKLRAVADTADKIRKISVIKDYFKSIDEKDELFLLLPSEINTYRRWIVPKNGASKSQCDKLCEKISPIFNQFDDKVTKKYVSIGDKADAELDIASNSQTYKEDIERRKCLLTEIEEARNDIKNYADQRYEQIISIKEYSDFNQMFEELNELYEIHRELYSKDGRPYPPDKVEAFNKKMRKTIEVELKRSESPDYEKEASQYSPRYKQFLRRGLEKIISGETKLSPETVSQLDKIYNVIQNEGADALKETTSKTELSEETEETDLPKTADDSETISETPAETTSVQLIDIDEAIKTNPSIASMFDRMRAGIGFTSINEANDDLFRIFKDSFGSQEDLEKLNNSSVEEYRKFINEEKLPKVKKTNDWIQTTRAVIFTYLETMSNLAPNAADWFNLDVKTIYGLIKEIKEGKETLQIGKQIISTRAINQENIKTGYVKNKEKIKAKDKEELIKYISDFQAINGKTKENLDKLLDSEFSYMTNIANPAADNNYKIKLLKALSRDYKKHFDSDDLQGLSDAFISKKEVDEKKHIIDQIDYTKIF